VISLEAFAGSFKHTQAAILKARRRFVKEFTGARMSWGAFHFVDDFWRLAGFFLLDGMVNEMH
jgi:hypothetical protein